MSCHEINTLRPRRNEQRFADDIFKRIFFNENVWISIKISLKFVPKGPINNIPALVQIMAWRRSGDKPLSEAMMVSLPTHICVTRPQWVKCTIELNISHSSWTDYHTISGISKLRHLTWCHSEQFYTDINSSKFIIMWHDNNKRNMT